jgi:hypothetical protein
MGIQARRVLATLDTECDSVKQLGEATAEAFAKHPDYPITPVSLDIAFTAVRFMCSPRMVQRVSRVGASQPGPYAMPMCQPTGSGGDPRCADR